MSIPGDTVRSRIPLFRKTTAATTTRAPARKQLLQRNKIFSNSANRRPNPLSRIRQRILADQRRKKQKPKAAVAAAGITHLAKVDANKNTNNYSTQFSGTFLHALSHGVICFVQTVGFWIHLLLAETIQQPIRNFHSKDFGANTRHLSKSMKICGRKRCLKFCSFVPLLWKMWLKSQENNELLWFLTSEHFLLQ